MRFQLRTEQWLPHPIEHVFAFFTDPNNLPRLMPRWQRARIESALYVVPMPPPNSFTAPSSIVAGAGSRLTLTIRPFPFSPVRLSWHALIQDFRWLYGFCDLQLRGPFRYWRHCHTLQRDRNGTLLRDLVDYELPLGPLSGLANTLVVRHQLAAAFRFRQRRTLELLAENTSQQSPDRNL